MKKKYYFIVLFLILVIAALYILLGKGGTNPQVIVDAYKKEWGLSIPLPDAEQKVYATKSSAAGKGQWFTIYSYDEKPQLDTSNLERIDAEKRSFYSEKVKSFTKKVKEVTKEQEKVQINLAENSISIEAGDYGFYQEKNGGKDYFIAIYKNKNLYTYTVHE